MQSLPVNVGQTDFALTSSFGHWAPQRICALAGMLSTRATAARVAIERYFIGFILIDLLRGRPSDGLTNRTPVFFRLFPFRRAKASAARSGTRQAVQQPPPSGPAARRAHKSATRRVGEER